MPMRVEPSRGDKLRQLLKLLCGVAAVCSFIYGGYAYWEDSQEKARARTRSQPLPDFEWVVKAPNIQVKIDAGVPAARASGRPAEQPRSVWSDLMGAAAAGGNVDKPGNSSSLRRYFIGEGDGRSAAELSLSILGPTPATMSRSARANAPAEPRPDNFGVQAPTPRTTGFSAELRRAPGFGGTGQKSAGPAPAATPVEVAPVKAEPDDIDFARTALQAAEGNVRFLKRAQVVVAEFARRYPRAAETEALEAQMKQVVARNAEAVNERSNLHADTPVAAVQFEAEPLAGMNECLAGTPTLEKLAAVTRPVSSYKDTPAFIVLATLSTKGLGAQADVTRLRVLREEAMAQIAPCLQPMMQRGTLSIHVVHGQATGATGKRIETISSAVIFDRSGQAGRGKS